MYLYLYLYLYVLCDRCLHHPPSEQITHRWWLWDRCGDGKIGEWNSEENGVSKQIMYIQNEEIMYMQNEEIMYMQNEEFSIFFDHLA